MTCISGNPDIYTNYTHQTPINILAHVRQIWCSMPGPQKYVKEWPQAFKITQMAATLHAVGGPKYCRPITKIGFLTIPYGVMLQ